jgi:NTE family protein
MMPTRSIISFVLSLVLFVPLALGRVTWPQGTPEDRVTTEILWNKIHSLPVGQRPRITLILGGGGARGLAHIGVLRVLEQERIPIDRIVGVSIGALIGALYAGGLSVDQIELMAQDVGWDKLTDVSRVGLMKVFFSKELFSTEKMEDYINTHIGNAFFRDLKIPFSCVAADLRTGDRVVFREGPVAVAARASATVPGLFEPVQYRQRLLVDGGIIENLPTELAETDENDFVLAVRPVAKFSRGRDSKKVINTLVRSIEIQRDVIVRDSREKADFLIEPFLGDISVVDISRYKESIDLGTIGARKKMVDLKRVLIQETLKMLKVDNER